MGSGSRIRHRSHQHRRKLVADLHYFWYHQDLQKSKVNYHPLHLRPVFDLSLVANRHTKYFRMQKPIKHLKKIIPPSALHLGSERSEEHTSELQSRENLVCRLLLEKKKNTLDC